MGVFPALAFPGRPGERKIGLDIRWLIMHINYALKAVGGTKRLSSLG